MLPPLIGISATSIWGICPGSCGLLAEASALAGVRMLVHIPPLASIGVTYFFFHFIVLEA